MLSPPDVSLNSSASSGDCLEEDQTAEETTPSATGADLEAPEVVKRRTQKNDGRCMSNKNNRSSYPGCTVEEGNVEGSSFPHSQDTAVSSLSLDQVIVSSPSSVSNCSSVERLSEEGAGGGNSEIR